MTLLRADPFTPLSCPACDKKFKSRKEASKHVKCAHFTSRVMETRSSLLAPPTLQVMLPLHLASLMLMLALLLMATLCSRL